MKKYHRILCTITVLLSIQTAIAQSVGIGTANPNASARLEVNSTTQGILIPTLTSAQRSSISNPATGLLVFQTNGTPGFYYYTGTIWINLTNGRQVNSEGVSSGYGLTTTLAGSGSIGSADGIGTVASFSLPYSVAVDAAGNVYVADSYSNKIRKITAAGVVSTFAGSGLVGSADGTGTAASFDFPSGVAVDPFGNVYVTDTRHHKIRKITAAGVVSTLAGSGSTGSADGTGTGASFNFPFGIAVDAAGNVYVADTENNKIRKIIAATGAVSTLAGSGSTGSADGTGTTASFGFPYAVAVDVSGNVYVADSENNKIRKIIAATGAVSTLAGSGSSGDTDGTGTAASFDLPMGITVDNWGNIYVSDYWNNKIRKITAAGTVSTLAGSGSQADADGTGTAASFYGPRGLAADASGNVYVADINNNKIRKIIVQ